MKFARFSLFVLLIHFSLLPAARSQGKRVSMSDIEKTLQIHKNQNKLEDWIYARIDFSYQNPTIYLSFLMNTEKEIWRKPSSVSEQEAWLMLLSNQGYNQLYTGNILKSINCYEQAYNYYQTNKLEVAGVADYVLKPWANNYTRLGDYEKALFIQKKTLEYAKRIGDVDLLVSVYNNMAISYRSMGDYTNAESAVFNASQRVKPSSRENILLDNVLADIYKDKNEFNRAEQVISRNLKRFKKINPDLETAYWLLSTYVTAGDIQFGKNKFVLAQQYYEKAYRVNQIHYRGKRLREQAYIFTQMGKVKLAQGQADKAVRYFNQTLNTLGIKEKGGKDLFGDNRLIEVFYQKSLAEQLLGRKTEALASIRFSLLAADKIRFELADVKTKQRFQAESKLIAAKAVDLAFELLEKTGQYTYAEVLLDIVEHAKARTLLDDIQRNQQQFGLQTKDTLFTEKAALERAISYHERELMQNQQDQPKIQNRIDMLQFKLDYLEKKIHAKYPALLTPGNDMAYIQTSLNKLPKKLNFIEFFTGQDNIYAIFIKNQRIKHIHKNTGAKRIKNTIADFNERYYQQGAAAMMNEPKVFFKKSQLIYRALLAALPLDTMSNLVLIPDEVLSHLSFDGLITHGNYTSEIQAWPFLIKKANISYAFSIQTWLRQSAKKHHSETNFEGIFLNHKGKNKQFIPAVEKEEKAIRELIKGNFFTNEQASAKQFHEAFNRAKVLHISTHAYLSGIQQEPTLALTDGDIYLFELAARENAPELVVLSACRTADGEMAVGEGLLSLSRGFTAIGTGGTIASLWNVNDEAASAITRGCYQNMIAGLSISTSLRQAKLDWIHDKNQASQNYLPYYWDALIYTGYDQNLSLQPVHSPASISMIIAGILLATFAGYFMLRKRKKR
jgi:CHAT domain-containing protein